MKRPSHSLQTPELSAPAHQLEGDLLIEELASDAERGLDSEEAARRLSQYGPNLLRETGHQPWYQLLLHQFSDLMIVVLFVAAALAWYLGDVRGAIVLMAIILINAAIGLYQEFHAEQLLERLRSMIRSQAVALRDGEMLELDAADLVPGDIVTIEEGGAVPADLRLLSSNELATNDFMLTGESLPQEKDAAAEPAPDAGLAEQDNLAFMGTTVARGSATGVVIATGMASTIGEIAEIGQGIKRDRSPLQLEMNALARILTRMAGLIALALFLINLLLRSEDFADLPALVNASLLFAIGVAAACVPQGLPAQITVALSLGVGRLARENAVVKRLSSVETLGCTTVICSDKTGTITSNQMTIVSAWADGIDYDISGRGYAPQGQVLREGRALEPAELEGLQLFFQLGLLAGNGRTHEPDADHRDWYAMGDPTEAAFMPLAFKAGLQPEQCLEDSELIAELAFDSQRKRMVMVRRVGGRAVAYMKGATPSVLEACSQIVRGQEVVPLDDNMGDAITARMQDFSAQSLRVIALAYRELPGDQQDYTIEKTERDFVFAGLVAMLDPPREGVEDALKAVYRARMRLFMLTGDDPVTAAAIAERIGMPDGRVITGNELRDMPDAELRDALGARSVILSRVSPKEKYRVVEQLKALGEVVAVTGDGVNDTLSLKRADIGVAMGKQGSEVAKEAAEIVLTDDDFSTLVIAVQEGRTIYQNLKSVILSSITSNIGELSCVCTGFVGAAVGLPIPLTAVQILSIDLVGEMLPLMALTFDPPDRTLMEQAPRRQGSHIINRKSLVDIVAMGVLMGLGGYFSFYMVLLSGGSTGSAQAAAFLGIVLIQYVNILSRRTVDSIFSGYLIANGKLTGSIAFSFLLVAAITSWPGLSTWFGFEALRLADWLWPVSAALVFLAIFEIKKRIL
ncbi:cation-translocating P-type ATPase [Seongchinamella unica]|uniref:cation-translocating P-type ATPase n=1 Tax=Seongchinamella unica TaxID=2547392 RepID=UPI0014045F32|nr:cation-transporting P-type ATPase [Seongchinamella unica]